MTTQAKINANRSNAVRSTGPNTANGKSHSRLNALRSGVYATDRLLPGEDAEAYEAQATKWFNFFEPVGPVDELLTDVVIGDLWRLGRVNGAEDNALRNVENLLYLNDHENTWLSEINGDEIAQRLRAMTLQDEADKSGDAVSTETLNDPPRVKKRAPLGCILLGAYAPHRETAFADLDRQRRRIVKDILRNSELLVAAKQRRNKVAPAATIHELRPSRKNSRIPLALAATAEVLGGSADITKEDAFPDAGPPAHSPQNDENGE